MEQDNIALCIANISAMSIAVFIVTIMVCELQLLNLNHPFFLATTTSMWLLIILAIGIVVVFSYRKYRDNKEIME